MIVSIRAAAFSVLGVAMSAGLAWAQLGGSEAPPQRIDQPPPLNTPSNTPNSFRLEFCNKAPWLLYVTLTYKDEAKWVTEGWWKVEKDQCRFIKTMYNRYFYYFAENEDRKQTWGNAGQGRCVIRPGPFKFDLYAGLCQQGHDFADFKEVYFNKNPGETYTIDLLQ